MQVSETAAVAATFGVYRAEWLDTELFELFTEPEYFSEFANERTCILFGGRGTGKTTVLRGLSYEGQYHLSRRVEASSPLGDASHIGVYYRVDTRRVSAFDGPELDERRWTKHFSHYINLLLCSGLCDFMLWYGRISQTALPVDKEHLERAAHAMHFVGVDSILGLAGAIQDAKVKFEAAINNIVDAPPVMLSMLGAPVDELVALVTSLSPFVGKRVFFLLDEYENFLPYQQRVVNTLIKHAGKYVFKIAVKDLGLRDRATLNPDERLSQPADYVRIDLREQFVGDVFKRFATKVCNGRLSRIRNDYPSVPHSVEEALPGLSLDEEAILLGAAEENSALLGRVDDPELRAFAEGLSPSRLYFATYWATGTGEDVTSILAGWRDNGEFWETRFGNYGHASLYTIRRRKRGIRKYYAGWDVFVALADGNIRYLLELLNQAFLRQNENGRAAAKPISADLQTEAAQFVGRKNLDDLEGLSVEGSRLTRLLLGLGRVFGVFAATPEGHTPELNQFRLSDDTDEFFSQACSLLNLGVTHQALIRLRGTKAVDVSETREYDYMIHPIFSAFFVISYRKKRKMTLTPKELVGLTEDPRVAIRGVLEAHNRADTDDLPDQMALFQRYFNARG